MAAQNRFRNVVPGFTFNLGFSGKFYQAGDTEENIGDARLLGKSKHRISKRFKLIQINARQLFIILYGVVCDNSSSLSADFHTLFVWVFNLSEYLKGI